MRNYAEVRLQNLISFLCALFFAIFSFTFIAEYKSALMELVYDVLATGKLEFNVYLFSATVTAILVGLALWLNRFAKFQREWTAMAYLPSALILAFVTNVGRNLFSGISYDSTWGWIFGLGVFVYIAFSFVLRRLLFEKIKNPTMAVNRLFWRNLIVLNVLFVMVGLLSGCDKSFEYEAQQYVLLKKGEAEKALATGADSPLVSPELTAQRAYILSLEGNLAEKIFEFPMLYGVDGLLPGTLRTSPLAPDSVYTLIGVERAQNEGALEYLERIVALDSVTFVAKEYYLVALLAELNLVDFYDNFMHLYKGRDVPKHFKEALVLCSYIVPEYKLPSGCEGFSRRFAEMLSDLKREGATPSVGLELIYGDTYWWYFLKNFSRYSSISFN